jgi:succinoglycan biosynthesis protein ExoO
MPVVSVIMANYNGSSYLAEAIASVRKQSLRDFELIVSDDASTDDSVGIVEAAIAVDPRIRLVRNCSNGGPSAARNRALAVARGQWIAVMDSDDLMHPDRLAKLMELAEQDGADIVADDLLQFEADHSRPPKPLLFGPWARASFWVDVSTYIRLNPLHGGGLSLGYLKPVFRTSLIERFSLRYDETLRLGEDYYFVLQTLISGAKMRVYPLLLYFYRKHRSSASHRLSQALLRSLKQADQKFWSKYDRDGLNLAPAANARVESIETALQYERLRTAMKSRAWIEAAGIGLKNPQALALLRFPLAVRLRGSWPRLTQRGRNPARPQICFLSRQRVVGRTNGSSIYLLDLAKAIGSRDVDVHFLAPSPSTLGRWPYLRLQKDVSIFQSFRVRGTLRCGRLLVSIDPRRFVAAGLGVVDQILMKSGLTKRHYFRRAPYSIAEPLTRDDQLYIARHLPTMSDYLIADYCFLTECFPYALRPGARTAVIMHDRFSGRANQFEAIGGSDSVSSLSEGEECRRLAVAESIVAIQADEGDWVRQRVPNCEVIVAPMAVYPVQSSQTGRDDVVLFVGSSAAPNVDGVNWFLEACWPRIRERRPGATLIVAGSVCGVMGPAPQGVKFRGFVDDLGPLYREAGVVVSPLRVGSGLKVKLIEALGHGKALVGTSKTLQGVERVLGDAIWVEDSADGFVSAVATLLVNKPARSELAARALATVARHFTPDACYGAFVDRIIGPPKLGKGSS